MSSEFTDSCEGSRVLDPGAITARSSKRAIDFQDLPRVERAELDADLATLESDELLVA